MYPHMRTNLCASVNRELLSLSECRRVDDCLIATRLEVMNLFTPWSNNKLQVLI